MNIILFGSPGSGKGTQAVMLSDYFNVKKISLGDILREEVKKCSELGNEVKSYMEKGFLVPDALVLRVIEENIEGGGFVLDGYPRNLNQAKELDKVLQRKGCNLNAFIYLDIDEQLIIDRLSKRRVCRACGANYHLQNLVPIQNDICDKCGAELTQRKDDTPDVIKKRWKVFSDESGNILDFYQNKGKLIKVDGHGQMSEIFERIKNSLQ